MQQGNVSLSLRERVTYRAQQLSFLVNATLLQETARLLTRTPRPQLPKETLQLLRRRNAELFRRDLANVEAGLYPKELLFQIPIAEYARAFPQLVLDAPRVVRRMKKRDYKDIPEVDKARYPAYYRRTFHWQTDGYFSEHSAAVYDLGVELLFRGTADVMRRQVIPPVTRFLRERGLEPAHTRLLDVACGTGHTLHQLAVAHPQLRYHGVDLSPFYVKAAQKRLRHVAECSLLVENAEHLPYVDAHFDVLTSVYLFHELPRNARRNVVREMFRVLRPGGLLVIEDSAQVSDSPQIAKVLGDFPAEYHEPFYGEYQRDDLAALCAECGFVVESSEPHLVAKVVVAQKPGQ
jgi:ubiquinone/menaquinone biosynthesis C-methylase UbiE